jgi:hypothetical protein
MKQTVERLPLDDEDVNAWARWHHHRDASIGRLADDDRKPD